MKCLPSKLSLKIIVSILIPIIIMGGAFIALFAYNSISWQEQNEIEYQAKFMDFLLSSIMGSFQKQDHEGVKQQLNNFVQKSGIRRIRWIKKDGTILFDNLQPEDIQPKVDETAECLFCHQSKRIELPKSIMKITSAGQEGLWRHFTPLINEPDCRPCHLGEGKILGFLLTDFSKPAASKRTGLLLWQLGLSSLVTILVISIILYITFRRMIDYPIKEIISRLHGISVISGKLNHIDFSSGDEIGQIVHLMNALAERLRHSREELASLYRMTHQIATTLDFEKTILASTLVGEAMDTQVEVIYENMLIKDIMKLVKKSKSTFYPVLNREKKYLGVITLFELRNVVVEQEMSAALYARDFYCSDYPSLSISDNLKEAVDIFLEKETACLAVVEGESKRLVGILDHNHIFQIIKEELLKRVGFESAEGIIHH